MKLPRWRLMVPLLASLAAVSCAEPEGLDVTVTTGAFAGSAILRVVLTVPGGFVKQDSRSKERVTFGSQDLDGDTVHDVLVVEIPRPAKTETFRVATGNKSTLTFHGRAMVFDDEKLVADGDAEIPLAQGGHAELKVSVAEYKGTIVSPKQRTTDLQETSADVTLNGTQATAPIQALAVCDFDQDGNDDIAVGIPNATVNVGPAGAVYIAFGNGTSASYEVGKGREFHLSSNQSGEKLGTAVACADLNGDGFSDLIVGAPGATNGKGTPENTGKVYVVFGRLDLDQTTIDFVGTKQPDLTWTTFVAGASLGNALFAVGREGTEPGKILASAPGASLVHLFADLMVPSAPTVIDADKVAHTTFAGVKAAALGAGRFVAKTGAHDIVMGDPEFLPMNGFDKTGVVYVFAAVPAKTPTAYTVGAATPGVTSTMIIGAEKSRFGAAVLALETTTQGQDFFVGAPGSGAGDGGNVYVYDHNDNFFNPRLYTQGKTPLTGLVPGGQFGSALARTPSGMAPLQTWRLLVGAPGVTRGGMRTRAGAAYMFGSNATRSFPLLEELFGAAGEDVLGSAVAGGQIDADGTGDLVTLAPGAKGTAAGTGVVYVKRGQ